jgi:uncharacterized membrane protein YagU involved in acid resistance
MVAVRSQWGRIAIQAIVAGFAGGICTDIYLWATTVAPVHGDMMQLWQWVASAVVGKIAFTSASYAWLGLVAHFAVAIAWAGGYAYLAASRPFMNERWYISGPAYGAVVYLFMQLVLLGAGAFVWPSSYLGFVNLLLGAHMLFYGLPVALVVSRMDRT